MTTSLRSMTPLFLRKSAAAAALLLCAVGAAGCGEDDAPEAGDDAAPCIGKCDAIGSISGALPFAVHAGSWDGQVLIANAEEGCSVLAVRPTAIDTSNGGVVFGADAFSEGLPCPTDLESPAVSMTAGHPQNPYPSNAEGELDAGGDHLTYALTVIDTNEGEITRREGAVIIGQPGTEHAEVTAARWDEDAEALGIRGERPTITADGGLIVFEGATGLEFARRDDSGEFGPATPLTQLNTEALRSVDGVPVSDLYPLSANPLRGADGVELASGESFAGSRPWISQDGTELFYQIGEANMVIGSATAHGMRRIDGRVAHDTAPAFRLGVGRTGSAYAPYPKAHTLPVRAHRLPTYPLLGFVDRGDSVESTYDEVDFAVQADGDYIAYLSMNALALPDGSLDTTRAGDISGQFNTALLEAGAEFDDGSNRPGAYGGALWLTGGGSIVIPESSTTRAPDRGVAVSMFVRPQAADLAGTLFDWPGVASATIDANGVTFSAVVNGANETSTAVVPITADDWTHVAMTFDNVRGTLEVYADGTRIARDRFARSRPNGGGEITIATVTGSGDGSILGIDEVAFSRVIRSADDFVDAATGEFVNRFPGAAETLTDYYPLPLGLDPADVKMPFRSKMSEETIELGMLLFFDTRLSRNGEVSCATCHDPEIAFTDGRATGPHIDGGDLRRATPTIFNRALSTKQFWDNRARTLEAQSLGPIRAPAEMGFSIPEAVALLSSSSEYVDRFQDVYGRAPNQGSMANALTAFQRSQLAGDSAVDRFEAGELDALSESEQRGRVLFSGKARCSACHTGSNYADEQLHRVGLLDDSDRGAWGPSGGMTNAIRAFKTPTLRNIDVTGPYFHNGSVGSLEEVVALYNGGPIIDNPDPESRALGLDAQEQTDLVAFLRALTSPNARQTFDIDLPELDLAEE